MNQDAFARLQPGPGKERIVRRDKNLRHRRRFIPIQLHRDGGEVTLGNDDEFRLRTASGDAKNAVAALPRAHRLSYRFHFTRELKSGNVLGVAGRWRVISFPLQDVGPIEACGADSHPDPIRRWGCGFCGFLEADSLDAAI